MKLYLGLSAWQKPKDTSQIISSLWKEHNNRSDYIQWIKITGISKLNDNNEGKSESSEIMKFYKRDFFFLTEFFVRHIVRLYAKSTTNWNANFKFLSQFVA